MALKWWIAAYVVGTLGLFGLMYWPPAAGGALLAISLFPGLMVLSRVGHTRRFLAGVVTIIVASLLEQYILNDINVDNKCSFLVLAAVAAGVEELLKLFGTLLSEKPIKVAISFAAGFSTAENVGFCLRYGRVAAITRAFLSIPMHCVCGGLIGAGVKRTQDGQAFWPTCVFFVAAVTTHFGFDAIAMAARSWSFIGLVVVLLASGGFLLMETRSRPAVVAVIDDDAGTEIIA